MVAATTLAPMPTKRMGGLLSPAAGLSPDERSILIRDRTGLRALAVIDLQARRIRELEAQLRKIADEPRIPGEIGLAPVTRRILQMMMMHARVSKEQIFDELYGDRFHDDELPDSKIVHAHISKLRRQLGPYGIAVERSWSGYTISLEHRARLLDMAREERRQ